MKSKQPRSGILLPPPAATILLYAADGLSTWDKNFTSAGFPRTPNRSHWVPVFRDLVNSPKGIQKLHIFAETGMMAWRCHPDTVACLKAAFRDITIRALLIASLERFAVTSSEKVVMPPAQPARPYPPSGRPTPPRPERPHATSSPTSPSGPHRPQPRHNTAKPSLG